MAPDPEWHYGIGWSLYRMTDEWHAESAISVSEGINKLKKDWNFLNMLKRAIQQSSAAGDLVQQSGRKSASREINSCGRDMDEYVKAHNYGKDSPKEFSTLLSECRTRTDALLEKVIIGTSALEHITLVFEACSPYESFMNYLFELVFVNLQSIMDDDDGGSSFLGKHLRIICDELKLIKRYLLPVKGANWKLSPEFVDNHSFVTHVGSVIVRIAIQSCDFWFNRKDANNARVKALGLVKLQHQIDPSNPEFMKLILEFHDFLSKDTSKVREYGIYFLEYMGCNFWKPPTLRDRLWSLASLLFTTKLRSCSSHEDVHCLFSEALDLFAEAAWHHRTSRVEMRNNGLDFYSYLDPKICILEMEFFLKEQLIMTNSVPLSELRILKAEEILKMVRGVTADLWRSSEGEYREQISVLFRELDEVRSLYKSFKSVKMTDSMMKQFLLHLVLKIVFFKAETFLSQLSTSKTGKFFINGKEQIESFMLELKHLKRMVTNQLVKNLEDEEMLVFAQVEVVVRRASFLSYSLLLDDDKFKKALLLLPVLLNKVRGIKAKLEGASSPVRSSGFSKTFELGFIDFLSRNIREVLKNDPEYSLLKEAQSYLDAFKAVLMNVSDSDIQKGELHGICTHFMEVAHELECYVDLIKVESCFEHSFKFYHLVENIRLVNEQVFRISEPSCKRKPMDRTTPIGKMYVDLVDEEKAIIDLLMRGSSRRDVVSIVGMPGIGKTTLAEKVYNDKNVISHFPRRAWCNVSQVYSKNDLLLDLLSDVHRDSDKLHGMSDDDLLSELRRCLLGSRYLIVLDDVWDTAPWDGIQISFPNESYGSRILITSRLRDVHSAIKPGSVPHLVRSFSDEESWMLLEKKIFKGGDCPSELMLVGKRIAENCQGLPLAVVAVAGLLQKTEKTHDWWEKISNSMSSQLMTDPSPENRCKEILELSYKHLPEYLKPCFLYMGVFLRDKEIPVANLVQFWLAEGFLQVNESKSLEVVAHDYLMELINRSLVIISQTRSDGNVKTCCLHDLFRDLCHSKARDDNFLHLVTRDDEPYASFPNSDYDMQFQRHKLDPVTFESYRLSIFLRRNHFIDSKPSGPRTRSLIFFASNDKEPRCPYEISFILNNFKSLRVLHLECINMGVSFPAEIGLMVRLRYLALSGYMQSVPPSIAKLWKLQTLVVRGFRGTVTLPSTIWGMASLRHLHVNEHVAFDLEDEEDGEHGGSSSCLENLVSFSTPSFSFGDKTICILRRLPNLLKMRCIFLESWESSNSCNEFPVLDFMSQLESLKIIYYGRSVDSGEFILPLSLKKLTLSNFRLPWKHIYGIGELPNLKVLKLVSGAFDGQIWEMNKGEFQELEFLKLEALNIAEWIAFEDHLPSLKRLVVQNCKYLEEIPQDFSCSNTLEVIEVQWCSKAVEESAEKIGELAEAINVFIAYN